MGAFGDYYVSMDGNDGWSGTLAEPNRRGTDGPFATLERAQDAVRDLVRAGLNHNVRVLVREGTYYLKDRLFLGEMDSGTQEYSITWAAYPDEEVNLVGGVRLSDWKPYKGDIWEAAIPEGVQATQVFENGRRMEFARLPKEGYFKLLRPVEGKENRAFHYRPSQLKEYQPENWDIDDAFVYIWPRYDWFAWNKPIRNLDAEDYVITLESTTEGYEMTEGNRYVIKNSLDLLTQPGECVISRSKGKVYVWPSTTSIEKETIVVSVRRNVITINGSKGNPVRNVHIEGFNLSGASRAVVDICNTEDCSVRFCRIENGVEEGVLLHGHAQRIIIYGNLIRHNGYDGVSLQGLPPGGDDVNHHNVVENNHIHHCGELMGHAAGVHISQSGFNEITHNHIHHMPRYGTTIKGIRYQVLKTEVAGVTFENRHDFLHSRNNLIAYNDIHHVNQDSQDTGAMESWGPGRDNVYDHNLVHDVGNEEFNLQSGMYLDDATDYFTVTNNIIWGVVGTRQNQCVYAKGIGNKFINNVFVEGPTNSAGISSFYMGDERCDHHEYVRNIFYITEPEAAIYDFYNWTKDRVTRADQNVFWKPEGKLFIKMAKDTLSYEEWRERGFEEQSITADPLFVNPEAHDYHLRKGSPALDLGIEEIDTDGIGLEDDFPERFERE